MNNSPPSYRRLLRFTLMQLLTAQAATALLVFGWISLIAPYRLQYRLASQVAESGGTCVTAPAYSFCSFGTTLCRIVEADLSDCADPAKHVESLRTAKDLHKLTIAGLHFADKDLFSLRQYGSLRKVILDSTSVTSRGVKTFRQSSPQIYLHLSERRAIATMRRIGATRLTTAYCAVSPTTPLRRCHRERVTHLSLVDCSFNDDDLLYIGAMHALVALDLHGVNAVSAVLKRVAAHCALQRLGLGRSGVTDADLQQIASLRNLKTLGLGGTAVTDAGTAHLVRLTKLQQINLLGTRLSDRAAGHLAMIKSLRKIVLDSTNVSDKSLFRLRELPRLTHLNMGFTRVTDGGLCHLKCFGSLQYLELFETKVSSSGVAAITKAFPTTVIHY